MWLLALGCLFTSLLTYGQFIVKSTYFETTGVSNNGLVAGYSEWGGPYSIWTPENQNVQTINGLAPGNGIGGMARFSTDGTLVSGTANGVNGSEMAIYSFATDTWSPLGHLGLLIDNNGSNGYMISGDGTHLVGNSWADTTGGIPAHTHAIVWNAQDGIVDLGTLFSGRSTRANAVSSDGSVIVGWQDFNGPWKAAVWRRNGQGTYEANTYLLVDENGSATDEFNQLGEAVAVSANGEWIGGFGDYANNGNPWLWSESTGYLDLGTLSAGASGYVAGISSEGDVAVGRFQVGMWDPELPFIWTPTTGIVNLNDFATNTMGLDLGDFQIYSANCLSENGDYIAGYGVNTLTFEYFTYRLNIADFVSVSENNIVDVQIYPNPTKTTFTVSGDNLSKVELINLNGSLVMEQNLSMQKSINIESLPEGVYLVHVYDSSGFKSVKRINKL